MSSYSDLAQLERRLTKQVDADFFEDPKSFRTLHRVIDILGAQLLDDDPGANGGSGENGGLRRSNSGTVLTSQEAAIRSLDKNPAYRALQQQRDIVESAIQHMSVKHCSELNGSVASVGYVARKFSDAVFKVRNLRKQVDDIKRQLHHSDTIENQTSGQNGNLPLLMNESRNNGNPNEATGTDGTNSLRELWLKKLESEAVLELLRKLEVLREAPTAFDSLIQPRTGQCRIGAAVTLLSNAISTMFADDVSQIQALTKIMDQLMTRKQKAEEIVWDTLHDVVYLRTGNDVSPTLNVTQHQYNGRKDMSAVPGGSLYRNNQHNNEDFLNTDEEINLFENEMNDDESASSTFSGYTSADSHSSPSNSKSSNNIKPLVTGRLIPNTVMETELDLEEDELICLEEAEHHAGGGFMQWDPTKSGGMDRAVLPRYSDATQALRILVETIAKLGRLDDIERFLDESLDREIRGIAEREQQKTLIMLERTRNKRLRNREFMRDPSAANVLPHEFKHHLASLLYAFGNVMLRLSHLAQILRTRSASPTQTNTPPYTPSPSVLQGVIKSAYNIMQGEIKSYLCACLAIKDSTNSSNQKQNQETVSFDSKSTNKVSSHEQGIFSLGIINEETSNNSQSMRKLNVSSSSHKDIPANQFVMSVLVPMTNTRPQFRYALSFRRRLERWTKDNEELKKELESVTSENASIPSKEETALAFLDKVIENEVLPALQDLAVDCTVAALERDDAFEPRPENIYSKSTNIRQLDISMCVACSALLDAANPLFSALHRLPTGSNTYTPLVTVLEYTLLAFISRVKQRVEDICAGKKANELLDNYGEEKTGISAAVEYRKTYSLLLQEYGERPDVVANSLETASNSDNQIQPIAPSNSDTRAKHTSTSDRKDKSDSKTTKTPRTQLDPINDLERNYDALERETPHLLSLLQFGQHNYGEQLIVCTDKEIMQAAYLAHSLLKFANILEKRLTNKFGKWAKTTTRALREAVRNIKQHGIRLAKFCRIDMLVHVVKHMSKICQSPSIVSRDQVEVPECVNDLGDSIITIIDSMRETSGNIIAAYTLSSLEQYIPLLLMQTVRRVCKGEGLKPNTFITLNGVDSLDRSGSVLYRDLKGASSFEGSFWDEAAAADAFDRSASFIALLEFSMDELEDYYEDNSREFSDGDYKILFCMNGPRRKGNMLTYVTLKKRSGIE